MLALDSGRFAYGVVEVVDEAMDVRRGVNVFVPVTLGLLTFDALDTARVAPGVDSPEGVFGLKPGVLGAAPTPR